MTICLRLLHGMCSNAVLRAMLLIPGLAYVGLLLGVLAVGAFKVGVTTAMRVDGLTVFFAHKLCTLVTYVWVLTPS